MNARLGASAIAAAIALAACAGSAPSPAPSDQPSPTSVRPSESAAGGELSPSPSPVSPLVGKWRLDRTCAAIVRAVLEAELPQLIPRVLEELVTVMPSGTDPAVACANAKPPLKHSHTFWPDGRFNS